MNCVLFNEILKKDITETYIILYFEKYTGYTTTGQSIKFHCPNIPPKKGKAFGNARQVLSLK